jgi:hypothetical protein
MTLPDQIRAGQMPPSPLDVTMGEYLDVLLALRAAGQTVFSSDYGRTVTLTFWPAPKPDPQGTLL